ncbi:MAG: universal stress protein [Nitrosopumilaceae archaeon]|nr:universal stress protein [Nitrosopumilaceae archaeon]NIU00368.1 universal stress protein [Nitrosopumilaceae archaeon]NIU86770.1 universal stress protein [Nitrosopumilaceae archaeon]NIV65470.1 universal stress protein [Nitrosopumilaceae archaeon]NIX60970.1 universal stress protein [Nitrosopumilaceae archaeon]
MKPRKILASIDGSPSSFKALDTALKLAFNDTTITCVYVHENRPEYKSFFNPKVNAKIVKDASRFLDRAMKKCKKHNIRCNDKILHGRPGPRIVSFAQDHHFDLIVMGSRGIGKLAEIFLGSVSNYVVHKSKIPVTIVK